jgi:hypothetical protein
METVAVSDYAAHRELVTGNLSFRAFGPRNFMKAQCSDGTLPQHQALCFKFGCDCEHSSFEPGYRDFSGFRVQDLRITSGLPVIAQNRCQVR